MPPAPPPKRHPYDQWAPDARALDLIGDKWTLLIVRDLVPGPSRFVELQRTLPGISTEQLRSRLNRMVADGMLTRKRYREVPPRVDYELTPRARDLLPILGALARWGLQWAWSEPRSGERVDPGAIFRLAPALVDPDLLRGGQPGSGVDLVVSDGHRSGGALTYGLTASDGVLSVVERACERPLARLSGALSDWIAALSPTRRRSGLSIEGDAALAEHILDALARPTEPEPASDRARDVA
jgi:DNA-binding HxlR family transcriptional regulator